MRTSPVPGNVEREPLDDVYEDDESDGKKKKRDEEFAMKEKGKQTFELGKCLDSVCYLPTCSSSFSLLHSLTIVVPAEGGASSRTPLKL